MQYHQLNWAEGLFLRPHHFQSADRYWHELNGLSSAMDSGFNYGVFNLEINETALDNQIVEVVRCQARSKQGTIVSFDAAAINRVDLGQKSETDSRFDEHIRSKNGIKVFLGVPQLKLSQRNVANTAGDDQARYLASEKQYEDEESGGNAQAIQVKDLNVQILFESDDLGGYELIPICRLVRSKDVNANLVRDPTYFPPCLATKSVGFLQRNIMEAAYDLLKSRSDTLQKQIVDGGISFSTQTAGAVDRLVMLQSINESLGTLNCFSFADGVHPFQAYTSLCQIIGRLSIFGPDKNNGDMPFYDHENLYEIFDWALRRIKALVDIGDVGYYQRYFKGSGGPRLRVNLEPEWFSRDWQIILGIYSADLSARDCIAQLQSSITWKLAAPERVDRDFEKNLPAIQLGSVKSQPSQLPTSNSWLFFSIKSGEPLDAVKRSCALSFRFSAEQVENLDELDNRQTLVLNGNQPFSIELAIFAVKNQR